MARCRGCGREIEWIKMKTGKSMPVDPERIMYWEDENGDEALVTPDGEVVKAFTTGNIETATGYGYVSHFSTCPNAGDFRRRGRKG